MNEKFKLVITTNDLASFILSIYAIIILSALIILLFIFFNVMQILDVLFIILFSVSITWAIGYKIYYHWFKDEKEK